MIQVRDRPRTYLAPGRVFRTTRGDIAPQGSTVASFGASTFQHRGDLTDSMLDMGGAGRAKTPERSDRFHCKCATIVGLNRLGASNCQNTFDELIAHAYLVDFKIE